MDDTIIYHPNLIDITGKRFGRLVVISREGAGSPARWLCRCDCGAEKSVLGSKLRTGNTVSCGCHRRSLNSTKRTADLTAKKIGRLYVICREGATDGKSTWRVKCECGAVKTVTGLYLKISKNPSCGCANREAMAQRRFMDLTGSVFGKLTVVEHVGFDSKRKAMWRCVCACGGERIVRGNSLKSGRAISCGCARTDDAIYMPKPAREESAAKCAVRRARKLEAGGSFSAEDVRALFEKQRGRCADCGGNLGDSYHRDHITPLSRGGANNILNIQLLCPACNLAKQDKDPIDWANENGRLL